MLLIPIGVPSMPLSASCTVRLSATLIIPRSELGLACVCTRTEYPTTLALSCMQPLVSAGTCLAVPNTNTGQFSSRQEAWLAEPAQCIRQTKADLSTRSTCWFVFSLVSNHTVGDVQVYFRSDKANMQPEEIAAKQQQASELQDELRKQIEDKKRVKVALCSP